MNNLYETHDRLILASNSPRRKRFLEEAGLDFEVHVKEIDETVLQGEDACSYVNRLAKAKGRAVANTLQKSWVLSADTIVFSGSEILGKPSSEKHAVEMLLSLAGKSHYVATAFCVQNVSRSICDCEIVETEVSFCGFDENTAKAYAATGEPLDKAGAYGIQGLGGMLVEKVNGSYTNVVGLPMVELLRVLVKNGVISCV